MASIQGALLTFICRQKYNFLSGHHQGLGLIRVTAPTVTDITGHTAPMVTRGDRPLHSMIILTNQITSDCLAVEMSLWYNIH